MIRADIDLAAADAVAGAGRVRVVQVVPAALVIIPATPIGTLTRNGQRRRDRVGG